MVTKHYISQGISLALNFLQIMKLKLLIVLIILPVCALFASNAKFYSINTMYGISLRETSSLCSDNNGFIWASSKTGIIRLTSDDYRLYQIPSRTTDYNVIKLIFHKLGIVAYTNNGQLFRYNHIYDRFDFIVDLRRLSKVGYLSINGLLIDDSGVYWIATTVGLYKYVNGTLTIVTKYNSEINYNCLSLSVKLL